MTEIVTALTIKNAPKGMLTVGDGLRFKSNGDGTGGWQLRYRMGGKQKAIALGKFPAMSLREAREAATVHRAKIMKGKDPKRERVQQERAASESAVTFKELVALAYPDLQARWKNGGYKNGFHAVMKKYVYKHIGDVAAADLTPRMMAEMVRPLWHTNHSIAARALSYVSSVLGWAEASGYECDSFACNRAKKILGKTRYKQTHHKSLDADKVPDFYATLGEGMSDLGLRFYLLTMPRAGNVTHAEWEEIEGNLWHIPAHKMKADKDHYVPLTPQALEVLDLAARFYEGRTGYIFKSKGAKKTGVVSYNSWTQQMRRHGLDCTSHGFRASFKDWGLHVAKAENVLIEEGLAHVARGKVESAYMRKHTAELRRPLMQKWANHVAGQTFSIDVPRLLHAV